MNNGRNDHDILVELHTAVLGDLGVLEQLRKLNGKVANHEGRLQKREAWENQQIGQQGANKDNKKDWRYTVTTIIAIAAVLLSLLR